MIDPDVAIGANLPEQVVSWTESDVMLYQLALGIGHEPGSALRPEVLRYTQEIGLRVLPSFGVMLQRLRLEVALPYRFPGVDVSMRSVLHGEQAIEMHRELPSRGRGTLTGHISNVWDKGSAAVVETETEIRDDHGLLCTTRSSMFIRGEGGFGGNRGPSREPLRVEGAPTLDRIVATQPNQALLYRLCGDRNPLHSDPAFAAEAGFAAPVLHGLCTYGIVCHVLVEGLLDGEVARVQSYGTRFSGILYPGDRLRVRAWRSADHVIASVTAPDRGEAPVLTDVLLVMA